jgi:predicted house-cleaning noncanonical NTP pyrophosphatase (MazG superfamily)
MSVFNTLVRDKLLQGFKDVGFKCEVRILNDEEYLQMLSKCIQDGLNAFNESGEISELVEVTEMIYCIAKSKGVTIEEFEKSRLETLKTLGGYDKRIFLTGISDEKDNSIMDLSVNRIMGFIKYLTCSDQGKYSRRNVMAELKKRCSYKKVDMGSGAFYYLFNKDDVWQNYFMQDHEIEVALKGRRIQSIDELFQYDYSDYFKDEEAERLENNRKQFYWE